MKEKNSVPVSVVIVHYKTLEFTQKALHALYDSTVIPAQVIVVDNNSHDGLVESVKKDFPQVEIIVNTENIGFAKANNQAMRNVVKQPFIWLLNSDTETGTDSLAQLYMYIEAHPRVAAVGPQLVYPTGEFQSVGGYFPSVSNIFSYFLPVGAIFPKKMRFRVKSIALYPQTLSVDAKNLDYVTGAACLLRKEAVDQVGMLAEEYFMYFEETDLCFRFKRAGWEVCVINTDPVMHVYGGSFKTKYDSRRLKLFIESLEMFVTKNYTGLKKWIMIFEIKMLGSLSMVLKRLKSVL
ncbi:MAG: glycosyltransferase family 2 protein [Candidatus Magasanikbacteria bacterium]|nr:glycosyltransferase family 2 protein [Candidatus Magasanikbacteria bacterium]